MRLLGGDWTEEDEQLKEVNVIRRRSYMLIGVVVVVAGLLVAGCAPEAAPPEEEEVPPEEEEVPPEEEDEAPPAAPEEEVFELTCQSTFGVGSWDYLCGERAVQRIEEQSNGRIEIDYLAPGSIVAAFEQIDAVNRGVLDMSQSWSGYWVGKDSAFTLYSSACGGPWGMDTWDHTAWMFFGGGYDLYRELLSTAGYGDIQAFMVKGEFPEPLGWFPEPLEEWDDLRGLKMRVAGMAAEVFEQAGVTVSTVPGGEILPLLEKGVIDAAEYSDPHSDLRLGISDVLKYYHAPGVHQPTGYVELMFNRDVWEELPGDLKALVESVSHEMLLRNTVEEYNLGYGALQELQQEHGVTLVESPDEILGNLIEAWDTVAADEAAKNPMFDKILESQREYAEWCVPYRNTFFKDYSFTADKYGGDFWED